VDHVHASELLGAYVLDSCAHVEAEEVRLHIDACAECTEEIDRLGSVAGLMGATDLESPPPHLRALVFAAAREMPPDRVSS
jgi:hypothetical protein